MPHKPKHKKKKKGEGVEVTEQWGRAGLPILVTYDDVTLDLIEVDIVNNLGRPVILGIHPRNGPNWQTFTLPVDGTFNRTNFVGNVKQLDDVNGYAITPV